MDVVWNSRYLLWEGLQYTFKLFAFVIVAATLLGILLGVGLLYGSWLIRRAIRLYVDVIRGIPLIVVIFLLFYGPVAYGINLSAFQSIAAALSIFSAAHMAEIVRGAVSSVAKGQTDAAKSLGLTFWPRFLYVVLPQAAPMMMGPWTNLAVDVFKGTSLAVLVSQADFLFAINKRATAKGNFMTFYLSAMAVYFVCCFTISRAGAWATRKLRVGIPS